MNPTIQYPAWQHVLNTIREKKATYGFSIETDTLSSLMRCDATSTEFVFGMLQVKRALERDEGFYLAQCDNGGRYRILAADEHEDQAQRFDSKVQSYACRAVSLRSLTLQNAGGALSECARARMERNLETAANRMALLARNQ